jgi:hypothetical protein
MVWLTPQHLPADSENGHSWHLWNGEVTSASQVLIDKF